MAILVGKKTTAIVQGITGAQGSYHTQLMLEYGTKIVAGTSPGKGGSEMHGLPVFDTVQEATDRFKIDASIIFVPAPFARDAAWKQSPHISTRSQSSPKAYQSRMKSR